MELLTFKEAAKYINSSSKTIKRMVEEKILPAYRINKRWKIDRIELEEWLLKQKNIKE